MQRFRPCTLAALIAFAAFTAKADTIGTLPPSPASVVGDTPITSFPSFYDTLSQTRADDCTITDDCYAEPSPAVAAFAGDPYSFTLVNPSYVPGNRDPAFPGSDNTQDLSLDPKVGTPEPTSLLLMATGALTTAGLIRRRLNAQDASPAPLPQV